MIDAADVNVEVLAFSDCNDEALLFVLKELRRIVSDVKVERYPSDAGGPTEVYFVLSVVGAGAALYLKSFLETLGSEHAKALNNKILAVLKSGRGKNYRTGMYPLRFGGEGVWFHLREPFTNEDFSRKLKLASEVVAKPRLPLSVNTATTGMKNPSLGTSCQRVNMVQSYRKTQDRRRKRTGIQSCDVRA